MPSISLKDAVAGQELAKQNQYNTDLFESDTEYHNDFSAKEWELDVHLDSKREYRREGQQTYEVFVETFVGNYVDNSLDKYLVTVTQSHYNGELRSDYSTKHLKLAGYNYFTKDSEPNVEYYNLVLQDAGYDITVDDIYDLGVLNTQYGSTTLSFMIDTVKHNLTINKLGQLSKMSKIDKSSNVGAKKEASDTDKAVLQSVFA